MNFLSENRVLLVSWIIMILTLLLGFLARFSLKKRGKLSNLQLIFESIYNIWKKLLESELSVAKVNFFAPFWSTIFCFIIFAYWSALIPWKFFELLFANKNEFYIQPLSDINIIFSMSIMCVAVYFIFGIKEGSFSYLLAYFGIEKENTKYKITITSLINGFLEWFDLFARPISLSARLLVNILVGEALTHAFIAIFPLFFPLIIMFFEFGIGILQSYIFCILTVVYLTMTQANIKKHHH